MFQDGAFKTAEAFHCCSVCNTEQAGMNISTNNFYVYGKFAKIQTRAVKKFITSFANDFTTAVNQRSK